MPSSDCCAFGCSKRGGFRFPADHKLKDMWIKAVNRKGWRPTKWSTLCKDHFSEDDFLHSTKTGLSSLRARLKPKSVPSKFIWKKQPAKNSDRTARYKKRIEERKTTGSRIGLHTSPEVNVCSAVVEMDIEISNVSIQSEHFSELELPVENNEVVNSITFKNTASQTSQVGRFNTGISAQQFRNKPQAIHYYTGLENYEKFQFVLSTLGPAVHFLCYVRRKCEILSIEDQYFLTLIKLRTGKPNLELSFDFDVSESTVENVFLTWINFMDRQWGELNLWPSVDLVQYYMPTDFKKKYPTTRVILDSTEIPIEQCSMPKTQQAIFSNYKNRTTAKVTVGCTPGGLGCFISPAYGGSTSDRQIVERSNIPTMCNKGDSIMVDKGINVQDIFAPRDVTVNIPTFMKKCNQFKTSTVLNDRKIASKRVHVERIIGLMKTFKLLRKPLKGSERILASRICRVCFMLINFRKCIVGKHA